MSVHSERNGVHSERNEVRSERDELRSAALSSSMPSGAKSLWSLAEFVSVDNGVSFLSKMKKVAPSSSSGITDNKFSSSPIMQSIHDDSTTSQHQSASSITNLNPVELDYPNLHAISHSHFMVTAILGAVSLSILTFLFYLRRVRLEKIQAAFYSKRSMMFHFVNQWANTHPMKSLFH